MKHTTSISIVIPALNEAATLAGAVATVVEAAEAWFRQYEVLIFDDGSTDETGAIADRLAMENEHVQAFHHQESRCLGGVIRHGWDEAQGDHVTWVDSQGVTTREALDRIFAVVGTADLVIPYAVNQQERPPLRRWIAGAFVRTMNLLFRQRIHQYTHLVVYPTPLVKRLSVRTNSYAFQAEALIKALCAGSSYVEVSVVDRFDVQGRKSKAFRPQNVTGVASFLIATLWDVYVHRSALPRPRPSGPS